MSEVESAKEEQKRQDAWAARKLLRACRSAILATTSHGQPFAALVTPATTSSGEILLLLSDLSEHTRHLRAEPRCALLLSGTATEENPQTAPRVSITGTAALVQDAALRTRYLARYLAVHPYAALYAEFGDFHLWQITPGAALFVGGFARATRLQGHELMPDPTIAAQAAAAAAGIEATPAWLDAATLRAGLGTGGRIVGIDLDGLDVNLGNRCVRLAFQQPIAGIAGIEDNLIHVTN